MLTTVIESAFLRIFTILQKVFTIKQSIGSTNTYKIIDKQWIASSKLNTTYTTKHITLYGTLRPWLTFEQ